MSEQPTVPIPPARTPSPRHRRAWRAALPAALAAVVLALPIGAFLLVRDDPNAGVTPAVPVPSSPAPSTGVMPSQPPPATTSPRRAVPDGRAPAGVRPDSLELEITALNAKGLPLSEAIWWNNGATARIRSVN